MGCIRVQPHFVRSLARSVLRTPRLRVSLRDFNNKKGVICGHEKPAGLRLLTRPCHDHDTRVCVRAHEAMTPPPAPSPCAPCGHMCGHVREDNFDQITCTHRSKGAVISGQKISRRSGGSHVPMCSHVGVRPKMSRCLNRMCAKIDLGQKRISGKWLLCE